jgi:hypothetical protein
MNRTVEITFKDEFMRMEDILIAGRDVDTGNYTTMFIGDLDLNELHNALFYINTGVIKILTNELGISLDDCDDFMISSISEALTREWNVQRGSYTESGVSRVIKYREK